MLRQARHERFRYAIALGSNRAFGKSHLPADVLAAALETLSRDLAILHVSRTLTTAPLGPSSRRFANAAAIVETALSPPDLLRLLKATERTFGRRPGRRWGGRPLDLDILLWSGGTVASRILTIPHRQIADRLFVLTPLAAIAPDWRLPGTPLRVRHLKARLTRALGSA